MSVDKSNLRHVILSEYMQFAEGQKAAEDVQVAGSFDKVVISGMGGSALPANVLRMYINEQLSLHKGYMRLPVFQNRHYKLPTEAYENALSIFCSHSGNTEETIASFEEALENDLLCIGVSSGGVIEQMCADRGIPHVKLPMPFDNFQPRMATGHFVSAIFRVLTNTGMLPDASENMREAAELLEKDIPQLEDQGRELATKLEGKTPIVYASTRFKPLAMIWKIKMNENAKVPAFWNVFPELNHNEFVGFTNPQAAFHMIMLRNHDDDPRNLKRFEITAQIMRDKGIEVDIIDIPTDGPILYRMFYMLALGDWASYHLALIYGIDPTPVDMVEDFKALLK